MDNFLDKIRKTIRGVIASFAQTLHETTQGAIKPNHVTIAGVVLHLIVVLAIINNQLPQAALLLAVFGLFDTLDGELARLQGTDSPQGAFLDSVTDRMKEIFIYVGLAVWLSEYHSGGAAAYALLAVGGSVLVSYVRAKGEADIRSLKPEVTRKELDKLVKTGLMQFEIRMAMLVVALLFGWIFEVVILISVLAWWTVLDRIIVLNKYLSTHQSK